MDFRPAAIIAEYNPFHNGHEYHIKKTRELGATHIAVIMSGNFVQRGDCACFSSYTRAEAALKCGADLVIQLPLPWAMAPAERFAMGAVSLADSLGCIDMLSFGSENGNIDQISKAAELSESESIRELLRTNLSKGMSYPSAYHSAMEMSSPDISELFSSPNDTLGLEYIRAINKIKSTITPVCIKRQGDQHDGSAPADRFASASFIRKILQTGNYVKYIPKSCRQNLMDQIASQKAPFDISRLETAMLYKLRSMSVEDIAELPDISEGLENRIYNAVRNSTNIDELISNIKSKRYTHARIRRILLYALLGIKKHHCEGLPPYIRILGINKNGRELLKQPRLPVVSRISDMSKLSEQAREIFDLELYSSDIFALAAPKPLECGSEARHRLTIV
ncbi:MAG: nucleotidyltransferase family protein [Clostridia bacterium]|nr:nucleotidyltransferase family protein [Clostridia bacterium]